MRAGLESESQAPELPGTGKNRKWTVYTPILAGLGVCFVLICNMLTWSTIESASATEEARILSDCQSADNFHSVEVTPSGDAGNYRVAGKISFGLARKRRVVVVAYYVTSRTAREVGSSYGFVAAGRSSVFIDKSAHTTVLVEFEKQDEDGRGLTRRTFLRGRDLPCNGGGLGSEIRRLFSEEEATTHWNAKM